MFNKQFFHKIFLLSMATILFLGHELGHAAVASYTAQEETIKLEGMAGRFSCVIQELIAMLKESSLSDSTDEIVYGENALLLYGPRGNGKTTLAKKIATISQAELEKFKLSGLELAADTIRQMSGEMKNDEPDTVTKIRSAFNGAIEYTKSPGNVAVILIDEVDYIVENKALIGLIRSGIDSIRNNPKIVFIATTNKEPMELDSAFQSRFSPCCQIKINNPSSELRLEVLEFYWHLLIKDRPVDKTSLQTIATKSNDLPIRALERLISKFAYDIKKTQVETLNLPILLKHLAAAKKAETDQKAYEQAQKDEIKRKNALTPGEKAGITLGVIGIGIKAAESKPGQKAILYASEKAYELYEILKKCI